MLNFLLWGFNEWLKGGESLQNACISQTKKLREVKSFGNLMNFGRIIQVSSGQGGPASGESPG